MGTKRGLVIAAAALGLVLALRGLGFGWLVVYAGIVAALACAPALARRLPRALRGRQRVIAVVLGAHVALAGLLWLPGWRTQWTGAGPAAVTAAAGPGASVNGLRAAVAKAIAGRNPAAVVAAYSSLSRVQPTAATMQALGQSELAAHRIGAAPVALDTAMFLGRGSPELWYELGQWYAGDQARPSYALVAWRDFATAERDRPGEPSYVQAAKQALAQATNRLRLASWQAH